MACLLIEYIDHHKKQNDLMPTRRVVMETIPCGPQVHDDRFQPTMTFSGTASEPASSVTICAYTYI